MKKMTEAKKYALIVAGGSGSRMGSVLPKQFMELKGRPVLMHTLEKFNGCTIILVLPEMQIEYWKTLCANNGFTLPHQVCKGGETRFHSVRNGLELIKEKDALVAIHDGVRPLITQEIIAKTFDMASEKGNAVAAVKLKDSIREITLDGRTRNANRNNYWLIQTPQTFQSGLIKEAYAHATHYNFTDDAGVLEEFGKSVFLTEGSYRNLKITTPEDLIIAEALLAAK